MADSTAAAPVAGLASPSSAETAPFVVGSPDQSSARALVAPADCAPAVATAAAAEAQAPVAASSAPAADDAAKTPAAGDAATEKRTVTSASDGDAQAAPLSRGVFLSVFATLCVCCFLAGLDGTIVVTAMPKIATEFNGEQVLPIPPRPPFSRA